MKLLNKIFLVGVLLVILLASFSSAGILKVTEEHPFLVNGEWVPAKNLNEGDLLKTADGKSARIKSIKWVPDFVEVFNLEAGYLHNFILSDGLVVHNSNLIPPAHAEKVTLNYRGVPSRSEIIATDLFSKNNIAKIVTTELELEDGLKGFKIVVYKDPVTGELSGVFFPGKPGYFVPHHPDMAVYLLNQKGICPTSVCRCYHEGFDATNLVLVKHVADGKWQEFFGELNRVQRPYIADFMGLQGQMDKSGKIIFEFDSYITDWQVRDPSYLRLIPKGFADEAVSWVSQRLPPGSFTFKENPNYNTLSGKPPKIPVWE
ncbi:MAG: hypothetical protein KKB21_03610 [Nanoarchaeota archaeon]|nr:hypothetical protein [Nanoarchaeota archaeon]